MKYALEVSALSVKGVRNDRLKSISFSIPEKATVAIIGPNGAGKSTCLEAILGLIPAQFEKIMLYEHNIQSLSRKSRAQLMSYVPQVQRIPQVTLWEWCCYARFPYQKMGFMMSDEDIRMIENVLKQTELASYKNTRLCDLSGGERQRAYIAAALCQETPLLCLDEPSNFLDPKQSHDVMELIQNSAEAHQKTILCVTHDINQVSRYFSHCLAIKSGEIFFFGEVHNVITTDSISQLYEYSFSSIDTPEGVFYW